MSELFVVNQFSGAQLGTKANPMVARTAQDFDALLSSVRSHDELALHLEGLFQTRGAYRWSQYAARNLGKNWTVDGDAEVALADVTTRDNQPLYCLAGPARSITGITTRGNHTKLADGWPGSLRTGGVLIEGVGSIDRVTFRDFGAIGAETFVAEIVGSGDITNCVFTDHDPSSSDDQVTVFRTIASENGESTCTVRAVHEHNTTNAPGSRKVQAHTIYQSPGLVRFNTSVGADVLYYGDYLDNRDIEIEENTAIDSVHGVQLNLSPTPMPQAASFSHEDYRIGPNDFRSSGAQVSLNTYGPPTPTRYIRNITVDASLSLENKGATNVIRSGTAAKKGCNPFKFLHR